MRIKNLHKGCSGTIIFIALSNLILQALCSEICALGNKEGDFEELEKHYHHHSMPKAGKQAGHFTKIPDSHDLIDCTLNCCTQTDCNIVFFFNNTCYMIHCNVSNSNGCQPLSSLKLNSTVVIVRQPEYVSLDLKSHETILEMLDDKSVRDNNLPSVCEFGLEQCSLNEECVLQSFTPSRQGTCQCLPSFKRDSFGICQPEPVSFTSPPPDSIGHETPSGKTTLKHDTPSVTQLTVSAGDNKVLQLPDNSLTLSAFVLPTAEAGEEYHYEWSALSLPEGSETARMEDTNTNSLKLSKLIAGLYRLRVQVTADKKFGEAFVNVTVLQPKRQNTPPVAIIKPAAQEVKSENAFILDGSDSQDDDKIVTYHWEEVSGPLQEHRVDADTPMLKLKDMAPGFYVFRLTVTDSDGATNSTSANVTIIKELDYPPKANAGSDIAIFLPQKSVILCGNSSTDDKGISSYEWIKSSDTLTADMTGVRTECLQLNNLEVGDYTFTLKVTDTGGNTGTADVHVFVKPETNQPPRAETAGEVLVVLPKDNLLLDGSNSTDDKASLAYRWEQISGPSNLSISNVDQAKTTAVGDLKVGQYIFKLTVSDIEGRFSSQELKITTKMNENRPPQAHAGGDRVVLLPVKLVVLDGSASSDDQGIKSYLWSRDRHSLGAGDIVNGSNHPLLEIVNLVAGNYKFELTVTDAQGLSSSDTASLLVKQGDNYKDLVQLILDIDIHHFKEENKINIVNQLELLLHQSPTFSDTVVSIQTIQEEMATGNLRLEFFIQKNDGTTASGVEMVEMLKKKLDSSSILSYKIITLDTVLCQNNCSGHGHCDQRTKVCHCEAFWMPNLFKATFNERKSNCEWSILYMVIVCFLIIMLSIGGVWSAICCCRSKRCRLKSKKRHRYSLLREIDEEDEKNEMDLMQKGKIQNSSVMVSESDFSSEEETLFITSKPQNGHVKPINGIPKQHLKVKLRT